ncbi:TrmH family RNA methyltransferase [Actinophytocola xanthii]|uniref:rRNA methyltransferase n=1 Tax=Actinophytocola xanthii TaxID=1912961 RepID=A0A1Q8CTS7_9PSEU|nr:RNA methyltransferase [Actinophytocola xanthii]OLF17734.1 rRNA methyltransferase [Actinophytocola xanthii]
MRRVIEVRDPDDARLDDFRGLTTADRRPDRPGGRGLVIAEGVVVVRRMLASRYPLRAVLGVPRRLEELAEDLAGRTAPVYACSAELMAEVVGFHLNRGVLAVADRPVPWTPLDVVRDARRLLVLEGVGDHENLGSLFRNAAALGVDGVLLGPGCADPLYRRSVRVSMGHVLAVPFAPLAEWPVGLKWLREEGFRVLAMTPAAEAVPVGEFAGVERLAVLLGSEGPGLTSAAIEAADAAVRIPMAGGVDSLNVATAGAVAFYALGTFPG